ncbi:disulfide reductase [Candidatus Bathyarchaeota archaeon]|nr:disulfide reductase [Candidatus Bathyarchaeota archaeon]
MNGRPDLTNVQVNGREYLEMAFNRCIKCSTCKYSYKLFDQSCPSGEKFLFESYWASGRIRIAKGLVNGDLAWNDKLIDPIFACTTCGACAASCQAPHADFIVDIIESLRELTVKHVGPGPHQEKIKERTRVHKNPYGEDNSDNRALKTKHGLPDKAEWVYFIGCTSNYRRKRVRDATLSFLKKIDIGFTLVDEYCCSSPLLRTGQVEIVEELMHHNIQVINDAGATKVVTSCAGCFRTLCKDYEKFNMEKRFEVYHLTDLVADLLQKGKLEFKSSISKQITYHDPCHLGRHMNSFETPRLIIQSLPGVNLVEMRRNRQHAWCCGAGGGVKIAYPDWSVEVARERLEEAKETGASIVTSTCPFCKTNLEDANKQFSMGFQIMDLVEILDNLELNVKK